MDTTQLLQKQIDQAPLEIKKYLANSGWEEAVDRIGTENNLTADQTTRLENEVLFVLVGFDLKMNFIKNVQENVGVFTSVADRISERIDSEIFSKVIGYLPTEFEEKQTTNTDTSSHTPPVAEIAEEKILSSVGSPGEKLAWEQRKQITANALPKADEKKYSGVDPYREPLQ